jgi:hypothetical protein
MSLEYQIGVQFPSPQQFKMRNIMSILRKSHKKRYGSETKMWRDNSHKLEKLLQHQNKTLYEVAREKDRLLHLVTLAIRLHLDEHEKEEV